MTEFDPPSAHHQEQAMRCIASYDDRRYPPLLSLSIHDAPHRRMHVATIQQYRGVLYRACQLAKIKLPIARAIDLNVVFVNPSSPDLGNVYLALERALDGKTLKKPAVLEDDSQISAVRMMKL
jgi:hypothetical protein